MYSQSIRFNNTEVTCELSVFDEKSFTKVQNEKLDSEKEEEGKWYKNENRAKLECK